ncbi:MAG: hypothetical protein KJO99_04295 [Nitrosopumilus sp.]|nr:hypothetical protein [Nitrosopumilus sp.]NNL53210.1 hypothetical protein [Nitrosopumilus sp.]
MTKDDAIKKLEISNNGITRILENVDNHFQEIRTDPRLEGLAIDLENLFHSYLKTWQTTNTEILKSLKE